MSGNPACKFIHNIFQLPDRVIDNTIIKILNIFFNNSSFHILYFVPLSTGNVDKEIGNVIYKNTIL